MVELKKSTMQLLMNLRFSNAAVNTGLVLSGLFWNNMMGFDLGYLVLIFGMFFGNVFAFVVNDFYDVSVDFKDPLKRVRNVFCSADTKTLGKQVLYMSLVLSIILNALASLNTLFIIILFNAALFFYSAPPVRFRDRIIWDWVFIILWKGFIIIAGYVYLFGWSWFGNNLFISGTLSLLLLVSLIGQIQVNQLVDFEVDSKTNNMNTVQRLGRHRANYIYQILLVIFYSIGFYLCYVFQLYFTMILILINLALYYFVTSEKRHVVLDYSLVWVLILFVEKTLSVFNIYQSIFFGTWIVAMFGLAIWHAKRKGLI
ncbi:MAG: UbiA family prenyltransferase [Candidatus Heimdallarchaeota archaeon]